MPTWPYISSIVFDTNEVDECLKTLKTDKASGPDGLSNRNLKELSHELSSPLCVLSLTSPYP